MRSVFISTTANSISQALFRADTFDPSICNLVLITSKGVARYVINPEEYKARRRVNRFSTAAATEELIIPPVQISHTQHLINGQFVDAASGKTFPTYDPRTGEVIAHVAAGDAEDITRAVAAARKAFDEGPWPKMSAYLISLSEKKWWNRDLDGLCLGMARTLKLNYKENQIHCLCYKDSEHGFGSGKIDGSIVEEEL
ncbi:hypothetical protein ACE6H2_005955 [Prunus campanulata]